jgi:hypothetical protein
MGNSEPNAEFSWNRKSRTGEDDMRKLLTTALVFAAVGLGATSLVQAQGAQTAPQASPQRDQGMMGSDMSGMMSRMNKMMDGCEKMMQGKTGHIKGRRG